MSGPSATAALPPLGGAVVAAPVLALTLGRAGTTDSLTSLKPLTAKDKSVRTNSLPNPQLKTEKSPAHYSGQDSRSTLPCDSKTFSPSHPVTTFKGLLSPNFIAKEKGSVDKRSEFANEASSFGGRSTDSCEEPATKVRRSEVNTSVHSLKQSPGSSATPEKFLLNLDEPGNSCSYAHQSTSVNKINDFPNRPSQHRQQQQPCQRQVVQHQSSSPRTHQLNSNQFYGINNHCYNPVDQQQSYHQHLHHQQSVVQNPQYNEFFVSAPDQYHQNSYNNYSTQPYLNQFQQHRYNLPHQSNVRQSPTGMNFCHNGSSNSVPTSPSSEAGQHSPLTPPSLGQADHHNNGFTKSSDGHLTPHPISHLHSLTPGLTQLSSLTPIQQISGFNSGFCGTPGRLTPISPHSSDSSKLTHLTDRAKDNNKVVAVQNQANLENSGAGVMHQMGGQGTMSDINGTAPGSASQHPTNTQSVPTNQTNINPNFNGDEEELPSCAYAHSRLHGLPFLVHRELLRIILILYCICMRPKKIVEVFAQRLAFKFVISWYFKNEASHPLSVSSMYIFSDIPF